MFSIQTMRQVPVLISRNFTSVTITADMYGTIPIAHINVDLLSLQHFSYTRTMRG